MWDLDSPKALLGCLPAMGTPPWGGVFISVSASLWQWHSQCANLVSTALRVCARPFFLLGQDPLGLEGRGQGLVKSTPVVLLSVVCLLQGLCTGS